MTDCGNNIVKRFAFMRDKTTGQVCSSNAIYIYFSFFHACGKNKLFQTRLYFMHGKIVSRIFTSFGSKVDGWRATSRNFSKFLRVGGRSVSLSR